MCEAAGIPVALTIDGANVHDMKLTKDTIESLMVNKPWPTDEAPQGMCLDKGYDYDVVREVLKEFAFTAHIRRRGEEKNIAREAGQRARRWVVERDHSWLNRFRGVLTRWCKKPENYVAMLHFACGIITYQQAGLFG